MITSKHLQLISHLRKHKSHYGHDGRCITCSNNNAPYFTIKSNKQAKYVRQSMHFKTFWGVK
mgnify:CR=1 FL=1